MVFTVDAVLRLALTLESAGLCRGSPVNKHDLIAAVAASTNLSKTDAANAVDAILTVITKSLKKKEKVLLVGFGTFQVSKRKAGEGRNPQTGEKIKIPAANVPRFKASKALKDATQAPPPGPGGGGTVAAATAAPASPQMHGRYPGTTSWSRARLGSGDQGADPEARAETPPSSDSSPSTRSLRCDPSARSSHGAGCVEPRIPVIEMVDEAYDGELTATATDDMPATPRPAPRRGPSPWPRRARGADCSPPRTTRSATRSGAPNSWPASQRRSLGGDLALEGMGRRHARRLSAVRLPSLGMERDRLRRPGLDPGYMRLARGEREP